MEDDGESEGESCSLLLLADELIDMVLSYSTIDHKDLCHCSQVCRRLNIIATGNELWKKKALSRYFNIELVRMSAEKSKQNKTKPCHVLNKCVLSKLSYGGLIKSKFRYSLSPDAMSCLI